MKSSIAFLTALSALMFVAHYEVVAQTPCWVPPASLVSWWTGDHNERDLYGVNNPSAVNAVTLVPAKVADGFTFGSEGYIDIPPSKTLANQKFTWDAWVKPEGPGPNNDSDGSAIIEQGFDNFDVSVALHWRATPDYRFLFLFGNVKSELIVSKDTFPPGAFYFVAGTYDGTTFRLYVNGVLEGTLTETKTIPYSTDPWDIGSASPLSRSEGFSRTFNGIIDEVEAFKDALSETTIQAIYEKGSVGKCKAPVVLTPTSLKFAAQGLGTFGPAKTITIANNRNNALTIDGFSFTGSDPADFVESTTNCGSTLGGRQSCEIAVTFAPETTGTATAVLSITDNAVGSPQTVPLSGTGVTATLTGNCVHMVSITPLLCAPTPDTTQCPAGEPAIASTERCGAGVYSVDDSSRCDNGGKCQVH